ncbi:MAG TPA: DUF4832 domain-containing protein, partial [Bacillota bacterium]|nr:DUF4832 domain-containing protein [Bacillota bacterium]
MKRSAPILLLLLLLVTLAFSGCGGGGGGGSKSSNQTPTGDPFDPNAPIPTSGTVVPAERDFYQELLVNPGKGWVLYGYDDNLNAFVNQTENTWRVASVGYVRFMWSTLEPKEGKYQWAYIDNALNACISHGIKFAFGVMPANSSSPTEYATPKYVFDAGAHYTQCTSNVIPGQNMVVPVWTDPIYLAKLEKFLRAVADRYDGNPNIAYMDIRGYGNWGENHVYLGTGEPSVPLDANQYQSLYLEKYRSIFPHTQLSTCVTSPELNPAFAWGISQRITGRIDGSLHDRVVATYLQKYQNKLPSILEFWVPYVKLAAEGHWNDEDLRYDIKTAFASYVSMGLYDSEVPMYRDKRSLLIETGNLMGYYFVLNKAVYDSQGIGATAHLTLQWSNKGVAPIFIPAHLAIALLDPTTGAVVEKQWLDNSTPSNWLPNQPVTENLTFNFSPRDGQYRLAIGLFSNKNRENPDIQLGIMGRNNQGWYVLS